jgi:NADH dehydrogenase
VVAALSAGGADVVVGTRRPSRSKAASLACPVEHIELHHLTHASDWQERIERFDVVVNCAGILRERWGETFDAVYYRAPVALAEACAIHGKRLIHVTALGLTAGASSGFITAKLNGENGIRRLGGETCIVRPSLLDGVDGFGARWLRRVAQWPVHFIPTDALGRLAPLHVHDLGCAIAALCVCAAEALPTSVELGGEVRYGMAGYLLAMRSSPRQAIALQVPAWTVRLCAHLLDVLHLTPLSWGHVELMRRDNVPRAQDALALRHWLGRTPMATVVLKTGRSVIPLRLPQT